jgi:hypothetical protein
MAQAESNPIILLFCPHCDDIIEILGEPPRPLPECEACGAELENCDPQPGEMDPDDRFEITPAGAALLATLEAADKAAAAPDRAKAEQYQQEALRLWNAARARQ